MVKTQKTLLWAVIVLIVLAGAGTGYYLYSNAPRDAQVLEGTVPVATAGEDSGGGLASDLTPDSLKYDQAVAIFVGKRIQFDENCRMFPARLAADNGSTLMFDNRSRNLRDFYLDGTRYTLPGYGFKLLQLSSDGAPHAVRVGCGTESGAGIIELQ